MSYPVYLAVSDPRNYASYIYLNLVYIRAFLIDRDCLLVGCSVFEKQLLDKGACSLNVCNHP